MNDAVGALSLAEFVADGVVVRLSRRRADRVPVASRVHLSNSSAPTTARVDVLKTIVVVVSRVDARRPSLVVVERIGRLARIVLERNGFVASPASRATRMSPTYRRARRTRACARAYVRARLSRSSRDDVCGRGRRGRARFQEGGVIRIHAVMMTVARSSRVARARAPTPRRTVVPSRASARAPRATSSDEAPAPVYEYETFDLGVTLKGTHFIDLTSRIDDMIARTGVREGTVHVISRHTTTAVTINEMEDRLVDDARMFFHELVPPGRFYLHNDLDRRHGPPDWPGGDEAWRAQEPENCHSHLLSMLIGNSESIPVSGGKTTLGTWQSCMVVELDGPRPRTVGIQIVGIK